MDIKAKIEEIVEKVKTDKDFAAKFQKDPIKALEELDNEISNGINIIKSHTGYKPIYFAYPYGSAKENGEREYQYIKKSDIKMAFISYGDLVYPDCQLEAIPRFMLK